MKRSILAFAVLSAFSGSALAIIPAGAVHFKNGWDLESVQKQTDGRIDYVMDYAKESNEAISRIDRDNMLVRDPAIKQANDKADAALQGVVSNGAALAGKVDKKDYAKDQAAQNTRDNKQDALIKTADDKSTAALQGVASNGAAIYTLQTQSKTFVTKPELSAGLAGKVDSVDFMKDQVRQDKALDSEATARADADAALSKRTDGVDKKADSALNGVSQTNARLTTESNERRTADVREEAARVKGDQDLQAQVDDRVTTRDFVADQQRQDTAARVSEQKQQNEFARVDARINTKVDDNVFQQRAANLDAAIAAQREQQRKTNATVAQHSETLANHEQRITTLEQNTNARFGNLKNQIDQNKREANAGIAGVAAIATIPQVTDNQNFSIGAGVGARDGESALAVGFSGRVTQNVVTKVAVSTDTQNGWTVGAGVSYGW